ncbi:3',5'-cyclic-nucleotide phosphodiesterase [Folsomia candida]|uniref:3',5'-cyclic-nucleotide phosphodiesterase n=1 Tax=Folsomia candida TaxID=158441 RepID=A0A226CVB7_FOLCA|nr:3',5'-cyclic-nucleotide phosphodiesterase [Folsomia candida]
MATTTIFLKNYENHNDFRGRIMYLIEYGDLPRIDIIKSRVPPCRLGFIILDRWSKNPKRTFKHVVHQSIQVSTYFHFCYKVFTRYFYGTVYHVPNTNAVITLVIDKPDLPLLAVTNFQPPLFQDLREGHYVSLVEKHTLQLDEWSLMEPPCDNCEPIDRRVEILKQFVHEIFARINGSLIPYTHDRNVKVRYIQLKFNGANRPLHLLATTNFDVTLIQTGAEGYQYLTCYAEPYMTLGFYLTPFQPELWATLGTTVLTIIGLPVFFQRFFRLLEDKSFSIWMYVLASLFEETGFMPSQMEKDTFFRISLGIWCLMSVVLTNGYNGIMISELNSPRREFHPESFDQLSCNHRFKEFLKYSMLDIAFSEKSPATKIEQAIKLWYIEYYAFYKEIHRLAMSVRMKSVETLKFDVNDTNVDIACYRILSAFEQGNSEKILPEFLSVLHNMANLLWDADNNPHFIKDMHFYSSKHAFYPIGFRYRNQNLTYPIVRALIEREIVECKKTVFVGKSSAIRVEYEFLSRNYPDIKFFMSSEAIQDYPSGISFQYAWKSRVVKTFKRVAEAGILTYVEKQDISNKNLNRTPAIVVETSGDLKPANIATLRGAWASVFILADMWRSLSRNRYKTSKRLTVRTVVAIAVAVSNTGKNN